jgi:hypothetical protein
MLQPAANVIKHYRGNLPQHLNSTFSGGGGTWG